VQVILAIPGDEQGRKKRQHTQTAKGDKQKACKQLYTYILPIKVIETLFKIFSKN
jgi:hypothetical protein